MIVNGKVIMRVSPAPNEVAEHILSFRAQSGENRIVLRYGEWNGQPEKLFLDKSQPLAVHFEKMRLSGPRLQVPQDVAGLPSPN